MITHNDLPSAVTELNEKVDNLTNLFLQRFHEENPPPDQPITIKQVSEQTKLSVPTLYGYVSRNEIPFSKRPNSKRLWFSRQEIAMWLLEGRKKTIAEIQNEANIFVKIKNKK